MKVITRKEARALGLKRYFTGLPCPKWHIAERYVGNAWCCECNAHIVKKHGPSDCEKFTKKHPGRKTAHRVFNRAKHDGLLCDCCDFQDFFPIYAEATLRGGHEVDHRKPRHQGGLHCLKNLQILTKEAHKEKTKREQQCRAA